MVVNRRKCLLILINLIICIICLVKCNNRTGYELLFLFPIALVFVILLPNFRTLAYHYIGVKILYVTMVIKCCLLPITISFSYDLSGIGDNPSAESLRLATILLAVEIIVVALSIDYFGRKKLINNNLQQTFYILEEKMDRSHLFDYVIIVISILFIVIHPDLMKNFSFAFFDESTYTVSYLRGLDVRLIQISIMIVFCVIVNFCRKRYLKSKNNLIYYLALLIGVFSMLIMKGENRASLLIGIISVVVVLNACFPEMKRKTVGVVATVGLVALISLSLYRMLAVTAWRPQGGTLDFSFSGITKKIEAYLSGPRSVAQGLEAIKIYSSTIETLLSDFLIWTGYLGNYISGVLGIEYSGTSILFNRFLYASSMYGEGDQIVPLCVQSIWHFGYIGSMLFSLIASYFLVCFDSLICKADSVSKIYANTMMACVFGLMLGYNVTIISMYFMDRYVIFMIIVSISTWWSNHFVFAKKK